MYGTPCIYQSMVMEQNTTYTPEYFYGMATLYTSEDGYGMEHSVYISVVMEKNTQYT